MSVSVVVPFNRDGAQRERNWTWLRARYERIYPEWEIVEHGCEGEWSKGRAVNAAAKIAGGDVFVIADADVVVAGYVLHHAVGALARGPFWVVPHGKVYRLTDTATADLVEGRLLPPPSALPQGPLARSPRLGPAGGGFVVVTREAFRAVGGLDERFIGWGGEDISFARALDILVGPHTRLRAPCWHLWHESMRPLSGRASRVNEALASRYLDAANDPTLMAEVVKR